MMLEPFFANWSICMKYKPVRSLINTFSNYNEAFSCWVKAKLWEDLILVQSIFAVQLEMKTLRWKSKEGYHFCRQWYFGFSVIPNEMAIFAIVRSIGFTRENAPWLCKFHLKAGNCLNSTREWEQISCYWVNIIFTIDL